jgi:DNA-binding CsgD family transcriptional regulator
MAFDSPTQTPEILRFAQAAMQLESQEKILIEFSECLSKYGFDFVFYKVKHSYKNTSTRWGNINIGTKELPAFQDDPFFKYCCSTYAPSYTGADFIEDYPFLTQAEADYVQPAVAAGFQTGMAVPTYIDPETRISGFNLGSRLGKQEFLKKVDEFKFKISLACVLVERSLQNTCSEATQKPEKELVSDESLTPRERDILFLLSQGFSRKEMALMTNLSPHTISDYIKKLYIKLAVSNRSEATRKAMTMGLTPPRLSPYYRA